MENVAEGHVPTYFLAATTVHKDGRHDNSPNLKPKCLNYYIDVIHLSSMLIDCKYNLLQKIQTTSATKRNNLLGDFVFIYSLCLDPSVFAKLS